MFARQQVAVLVVTALAIEDLVGYREAVACEGLRLFADPGLRAYRAYGLGHGTWGQLLHPSVWRAYVRLWREGAPVRRPDPRDDWRQLGGDFLVDPAGMVHKAHYSQTPADRPVLGEWLPPWMLVEA